MGVIWAGIKGVEGSLWGLKLPCWDTWLGVVFVLLAVKEGDGLLGGIRFPCLLGKGIEGSFVGTEGADLGPILSSPVAFGTP